MNFGEAQLVKINFEKVIQTRDLPDIMYNPEVRQTFKIRTVRTEIVTVVASNNSVLALLGLY